MSNKYSYVCFNFKLQTNKLALRKLDNETLLQSEYNCV